MTKKFVLTETTKEFFGITLYQIKAVRSFADIEEGELGGFIEKESNLDHDGDAWVSGNAQVFGNARVYGNAQVSGNARVYSNAQVYGNTWVYSDAWVFGDARVYGDARVQTCKHVAWFSSVGSENGTLTAYTIKTGEIEVTRGCFRGTLEEFESAVQQRHGDTQHGQEYLLLIQFIKVRFKEVKVEIEESA